MGKSEIPNSVMLDNVFLDNGHGKFMGHGRTKPSNSLEELADTPDVPPLVATFLQRYRNKSSTMQEARWGLAGVCDAILPAFFLQELREQGVDIDKIQVTYEVIDQHGYTLASMPIAQALSHHPIEGVVEKKPVVTRMGEKSYARVLDFEESLGLRIHVENQPQDVGTIAALALIRGGVPTSIKLVQHAEAFGYNAAVLAVNATRVGGHGDELPEIELTTPEQYCPLNGQGYLLDEKVLCPDGFDLSSISRLDVFDPMLASGGSGVYSVGLALPALNLKPSDVRFLAMVSGTDLGADRLMNAGHKVYVVARDHGLNDHFYITGPGVGDGSDIICGEDNPCCPAVIEGVHFGPNDPYSKAANRYWLSKRGIEPYEPVPSLKQPEVRL